jgi:hypothetical protein|tara:strand:- start:12049 stop:12726 length:678 start_codon:yes stop_codon:yes gene_type:complete
MTIEELVDSINVNRKRRDLILERSGVSYQEAWIKAAKKLLYDKDGNPDLDRLDDPLVQQQMVEIMHEHMIDEAAEFFNLKGKDVDRLKEGDLMKGDMLANAYADVTQAKLSEIVTAAGSDYTLDVHTAQGNELKKAMKQRLTEAVYAPVKRIHARGVLEHVEAPYLAHHAMTETDVAEVLERWFGQNKRLAPKDFKNKAYLRAEFRPYRQQERTEKPKKVQYKPK